MMEHDRDTEPHRRPLWAHPLVILAGPYIAAAAGWLIATLLNALLWGHG